ncbi:hypothetical protein CAJAP_01007 [Camponotus japonicus]
MAKLKQVRGPEDYGKELVDICLNEVNLTRE